MFYYVLISFTILLLLLLLLLLLCMTFLNKIQIFKCYYAHTQCILYNKRVCLYHYIYYLLLLFYIFISFILHPLTKSTSF